MASIYVDVDISNFDTDDIIEELENRLKRLSKKEKELLDDLIIEYRGGVHAIIKTSKVDHWKAEVFAENHHRRTLDEIETFFQS